jgi:hypothetical protein
MTGKSVLAKLLLLYARQYHPDTVTVFLTWQLVGDAWRGKRDYKEFICSLSEHTMIEADFTAPRNPILIILDEAQLSYEDSNFWIEFVKIQASPARTPNLRAVLFSSWGSASSKVLNIRGSVPVVLSDAQRVELITQPGWPHNLALCFDFKDVEDIGARMSQEFRSNLDRDIIEYVLRMSNGHPGVTMGLFISLFNSQV